MTFPITPFDAAPPEPRVAPTFEAPRPECPRWLMWTTNIVGGAVMAALPVFVLIWKGWL